MIQGLGWRIIQGLVWQIFYNKVPIVKFNWRIIQGLGWNRDIL